MVNEVTYSMLEKMAAANGRSDVEAFAKEQGFTEAMIADMKLREAKLGGDPGAPGEITSFSSYHKVNINGIKGVLSLVSEDSKDGTIKLSAEARKQLSEFGVEKLVMHDGVLYAQHKDGNEYPVGQAESFHPDFAALEEHEQRERDLSMAKGIYNGTRNMIIAGLQAMGIFGACDNDIEVSQNNQTNVPIKLSSDDKSEIIALLKEQNEYLKGILGHVSNIDSNLVSQYNSISAQINKIVNNTASFDEIKTVLLDVLELIADIKANQEQSMLNNKTQLDNIISALDLIVKYAELDAAQKEELLALLKSIKSDTGNIKDYISEAVKKLEELVGLNKDQSAKLETIVTQNEDIKKVLEAIYEKIGKLDGKLQEYFKGVVAAIVANGAKLDALAKLLNTINNNVVNGNAAQQKQAEAILAVLQELNFNVVDGMGKILEEVMKGNVKLDEILKVLNEIKALVAEYGERGTKLGNAILEAISNVNASIKTGFDGISDLIKQIVANQNITNGKIDKLTTLFSSFSGTAVEKLNTIIEKMGTDSAKLDQIIELLVQMDANNGDRCEKIFGAIAAVGFDVVTLLKEILDAIKKGNKGVEALLNTIIANQETMIKDNKDGFTAVLEAIKNISVDPDLSEIKELLAAIKDGVKDNGKILQEIKNSNDVIRTTLVAFVKSAGDHFVNSEAWLEKIYNKIPEGGTGGCKVDFDVLMAKLDDILKAIKNHKVDVTVTGEVICKCDCGQGGTHEGIIGDLNTLLG